uniref:Guanine nucleotide-binding protein subunit gamma n=1 Tax=Psilocybe cubensis TaxID=181762 RepID=A0A8H7Y1X9_PSICU
MSSRTGGRQSMSELKLRRLIEHNQRLREDLARPRVRVSEASASLIRYCKTTKDHLVRTKRPFPFVSRINWVSFRYLPSGVQSVELKILTDSKLLENAVAFNDHGPDYTYPCRITIVSNSTFLPWEVVRRRIPRNGPVDIS